MCCSLVSEEDYFKEATGVWDVEGLEDDLRVAKDQSDALRQSDKM